MKRAQHTEHCEQILGKGFREVHDYLDQYADKLGPEHRAVLHTPMGVVHCIQKWGYMAGAAACLHIWADAIGLVKTDDGKFKPAKTFSPRRKS